MAKYTNNKQIPLSLAIWLATDSYKHDDRPNHISATALLQPIRALILQKQYPELSKTPQDISTLLASKIGTAIHDSIETAWINNHKQAMVDLDLPKSIIQRTKINPTNVDKDDIPVYTECRTEKELDGYIISGEFDFTQNAVQDYKYTGTYTYQKDTNSKAYIQQLSTYRWLHSDKIKDDIGYINYIFKNWSAAKTYEENYPNADIVSKAYPLMSVDDTVEFIRTKLSLLTKHITDPSLELPLCTKEDLWQNDTIYAYYRNPDAKRATKNFNNPEDAYTRVREDGNVGIVQERMGQARKCYYCPARPKCTQADNLVTIGVLK